MWTDSIDDAYAPEGSQQTPEANSGAVPGYVPKTGYKCERCLRMAPQAWEWGETGVSKEEWWKKQVSWWDGRAVHMGCNHKCGF